MQGRIGLSRKGVHISIIHTESDCSHLRTSWLDPFTTSATASNHLRQDPAFATAMRNIPSFGAFIKLFDTFELITSNTSGGTSKVRLTDNAPPRCRRARTKRPDPKIKLYTGVVLWRIQQRPNISRFPDFRVVREA